jgi:hypothetical protein
MSLRSRYAREVLGTFGSGYHANWFPDTPCPLGTYGRIQDDVLIAYGNLRDIGVHYDIDTDTIPSALEINVSKNVSIAAKLQGSADASLPHIPAASVGLGMEFGSEGAFAIAAAEVYEDRITNPGTLEEQLIKAKDQGKWDSDYRIVTGVLRMPVATILISQADNTKVELSLDGTLIPSIKELGKASVSATFHWESSGLMKYAPARNAVPIIQLHRLALGFWPFQPPRLRTFSMETVQNPGAEESWQLVLDEQLPARPE